MPDWHESFELIFSELCDEAQARFFLHKEAYEYYSGRSIQFQVPVMVLSAVSGSGNFLSSSFPVEYQKYIIIGIGCLSITIGILSSLAQYFKYSELSEAHRISFASWEKFHSNVKLQIRRCRDYRDDLAEFLNNVVEEYLRLKEVSPAVPDHITRKVSRQGRRAPKTLQLPFILSGFQHVSAYESEPSIQLDSVTVIPRDIESTEL